MQPPTLHPDSDFLPLVPLPVHQQAPGVASMAPLAPIDAPLGHWKHFADRDFMFPCSSSYSTWHPQVLLLTKIPLPSPNALPCQCWSSILRSHSVVAVSRPHCHRLNWALCNRPLHIHFPIKKVSLRHCVYRGFQVSLRSDYSMI